MSKKTETAKNSPAYHVFCVTNGEGDKAAWAEIGSAWKHKDGLGFNIQLKALPLPEGRIVLREPKAKEGGAQ